MDTTTKTKNIFILSIIFISIFFISILSYSSYNKETTTKHLKGWKQLKNTHKVS